MKPQTAVKVYLITGSILVIVCAIFAGCFGLIFNAILENLLVISEDSDIWETYIGPDVPIYMDFYMFNVTNPVEVQYYGAKAELVEIGPYRYLEKMSKRNWDFGDDGNTISYYQDKEYHFDAAQSNGLLESDKITTVNAVMVIIASMIYPNHKVAELIWPEFEKGMDLFESHTVAELTFAGWDLPIFNYDFSDIGIPNIPEDAEFNNSLLNTLQNLDQLLDKTENLNGTLYDILLHFGYDIDYLKLNKVGIFYGSNGTDDGHYKVYTGKGGMDNYLNIIEWKDKPELDYWGTDYCNMLNGTDGSQFPPGVPKEDTLRLYTSDLCRSIFLEFEKDKEVLDLVKSYHYVSTVDLLAAPVDNADNECYCTTPLPYDTTEDCFNAASMLSMAECSAGAPIVLSTPHFFMGHDEDIKNFIGLFPDKEKHETYLDVEPTTGVVIEAAKKIQVNVPIRRYANFPAFRNIRENVFPVFWGNENYQLPKDDAETLHKILTLPFILVYSICGVLILLGIALIIVGLVKRSKLKREPSFGKLEDK